MRWKRTVVDWTPRWVVAGLRRTSVDVLAHRILHEIGSLPFDTGEGNLIFRTCSIGWVPFPWITHAPSTLKFEDALFLADQGLYKAKSLGRNQSVGMLPGDRVD